MSTVLLQEDKTPILLLKTKSSPNDGYEEYFEATSQFIPSFIPVLEHKYNTETLQAIRRLFESGDFTGPQRKYGGLIFTSQRAVEGFASVVQEIQTTLLKPFDLVLYVVGPATSRSLKSLQISHLTNAQVLGEETGNGENLAQFILDHYNSVYPSATKPPLLFLVGEQRRDVIPKTLMSTNLAVEKRIEVEETVVYGTGVMASFESLFLKELQLVSSKKMVWVVVFSPTGCEAMLRNLSLLDNGTGRAKRECQVGEGGRHYVATIGPTTQDYLRKTFGFEPHVCATKPSPEGIAEAIEKFVSQQENTAS